MSNSLRSLRKNEQLWANQSGRSCQKSNCEWIAQVAHDKRATVSDLLRVLMRKEQMSQSLFFIANCSFALSLTKNEQFAKKNVTKILFFGTFFVCFFASFFLRSNLLIPSFLMSDVSELLRSLTKMSKWANRLFFRGNVCRKLFDNLKF